MRALQILVFAVAVVVSFSALFYIGTVTGDVLWRAGVSILLIDIIWILLWPGRKHKSM